MQSSPRIDELRQKFHENPRRYFAPLANEYRKAGDPEQAIAICRAHLAQQPAHMSGHVVYGQALYDAKRTEEARAVFEKALALDPENAIVLRQLGDIARERGESSEARHWYKRALDNDPHDAEVAAYVAELAEPVIGSDSEPVMSAAAETVADVQPTPEAEPVPQPEPFAEAESFVEAESVAEAEPVAEAESGAEAESDVETDVNTEELRVDDASDMQPPVADDANVPFSFDETLLTIPADEALETDPEIASVAAMDEVVQAPVVAPLADVAPEPPPASATEREVPWRKTPPHEDSPFVTRTMAELYAKQGYHAAALDVFRQLALQHPEDSAISERIDELSKLSMRRTPPKPRPQEAEDQTPAAEDSVSFAAGDATGHPDEVADLSVEEQPPGLIAREEEPGIAIDDPDDVPTGKATNIIDWDEPSSIYSPPAAEDLNRAPEVMDIGTPTPSDKHFTEVELGPGDVWDTDVWASGFSPEDRAAFGHGARDEDALEKSPIDEASISESLAESLASVRRDAPEPEAEVAQETVEETPVVSEEIASEEPAVEEAAAAVEEAPAAVDEVEAPVDESTAIDQDSTRDESPRLVAYSPAPRAEETQPRAPRAPTVREFFATLGSRRPSRDEGKAGSIAAYSGPSGSGGSDDNMQLA
ncbi:MAG TPA: tetratricopeptide repeat protein, partial [Gemmatimonadaceae bacterium]|nr:tetratricopeptide repeat protein [Gemmatimonadaceae bacterium]